MDPQDWFVVSREAAIIEEILLDKLAIIILFLDVDCFLIFVINETNQHNKEIGNRQFHDFVFEHFRNNMILMFLKLYCYYYFTISYMFTTE